MASIQTINKITYLVYDNPFSLDKRRQVYEKIPEGRDPELVLAEFTVKKKKGKLIIPQKVTVEKLAREFVIAYGTTHWGYATYDTNEVIVEKHIIGEIGQMQVKDVTELIIEKLLMRLSRKKITPPRGSKIETAKLRTLSTSTQRITFDLLLKMFDCAVQWRIIEEENHPVPERLRPEKVCEKREAWSGRQCGIAMPKMRLDGKLLLQVAFHTLFACSLRNSEAMAISIDSIDFKRGRLKIDKTIKRVSKKALKKIPQNELLHVFPNKKEDSKTSLVLKTPKTDSSNRVLYLPKELLHDLVLVLNWNAGNKRRLGDEYQECKYDLLFRQEDGTPIEPQLLCKWFTAWQKKAELGFPLIDVHSIRHSSAAHKVKISNGDFSSVRADTGHATMKSVTDYADHEFDEYRKKLLESLEESTFYNPDDSDEENKAEKEEDVSEQILLIMQKNPAIKQRVLSDALHAMLAKQ